MPRTSLFIDRLKEVKRMSVEQNRTIKNIINTAVNNYLDEQDEDYSKPA